MNAEEFIRMVADPTTKVSDLSLMAEEVGHSCDDSVVPALKLLLMHHSALVREGAIIGLGLKIHCHGVVSALERARDCDQNNTIREFAADILDFYL